MADIQEARSLKASINAASKPWPNITEAEKDAAQTVFNGLYFGGKPIPECVAAVMQAERERAARIVMDSLHLYPPTAKALAAAIRGEHV